MKKLRTILILGVAFSVIVVVILNRVIERKELSDKMKKVRAGQSTKKPEPEPEIENGTEEESETVDSQSKGDQP
jgi:ATP/ADP translocase